MVSRRSKPSGKRRHRRAGGRDAANGRTRSNAIVHSSVLAAFLRGLPHAGRGGFEGLVAAVLTAETGQRFRIQKSGAQRGRDAETEAAEGNLIAVEAKHYFASSLDRRELLGELAELSGLSPRPDLWILASTAPAAPDDWREIVRVGAEFGFDCLCLDGGGDAPRLLVLMAAHPEAVEIFAARHAADIDRQGLLQELAEVRASPAFEAERAHLRRALDGTLLGFDDALARARAAVLHAIGSEAEARRRFGQNAAVRAPGALLVKRLGISASLARWLEGPATAGRHAAVLGDEGTGKTWAVLGSGEQWNGKAM